MSEIRPEPLVLTNRHNGERLELIRFKDESGPWLEIKGSLPPSSEGPPLHIHMHESEGGRVLSGTLSAVTGGRPLKVGPGGELSLPKGEAHRWWNDGDEELVFDGYARPVVDVDRYLQAMFEVLNAGPEGRPPLFYVAHAMLPSSTHPNRPGSAAAGAKDSLPGGDLLWIPAGNVSG